MGVNAWTPLHEPIFLDIEAGMFCSLLQIPRIPREVSFEEILFTNSNFEFMTPSRREQHAAGRYCLNSVINKAEHRLKVMTFALIGQSELPRCDFILTNSPQTSCGLFPPLLTPVALRREC